MKMTDKHEEISFLLKSLSDLVSELKDIDSIEEIFKNFLMITMGNFGITLGFILWIETVTNKKKTITRGIEQDDIEILNQNVNGMFNTYFSSDPDNTAFVKQIKKKNNAGYMFCSKETELLFQWNTGSEIAGLAGFGKKINSGNFTFLDTQLLTCFLTSLIPHLCYAESIKTIYKFNSDIYNKNMELSQQADRTRQTDHVLNQRLYYLNTLYDTLIELGNFSNPETITETFLLTIMGTFSVKGGYSLLLDKKDHTAKVSCRGIDKEKLNNLPADTVEKLVSSFLKGQKELNQPLFNVRVIADTHLLNEISSSLEPGIGIFFYLDETTIGITILGKKITGQRFLEEDHNILKTLAGNYILFLKNARSIEITEKLNKELEMRNSELEQTIQELKTSQNRIRVLETVKTHFKTVITKEIEKSRKASIMDIIIILFASLALGTAFNLANPEGINIIPESLFRQSPQLIDTINAKQKYDKGIVVFIDARPANFFEQKHIKGAENLPLPLFDFVYMMKISSLDPEKEIIVYGRNISRHYDEDAAFKLKSRNHKNVKILSGGIKAWEKMGYPTGP